MARAIITATLTLALGVLLGVAVANQTGYLYHADDLRDTTALCEADGLTDCHSEAIMDGLVVVDYEIIGWDENNVITEEN